MQVYMQISHWFRHSLPDNRDKWEVRLGPFEEWGKETAGEGRDVLNRKGKVQLIMEVNKYMKRDCNTAAVN